MKSIYIVVIYSFSGDRFYFSQQGYINMRLKKYLTRIIATGITVSVIMAFMISSDIYYSKLEKEYPLLAPNEQINGTITSFKDHFDYTYIEIDSSVKRLIRPTNNNDYEPTNFSDFISNGDKIVHDKWSSKIVIVKNDVSYRFELMETFN